MFRVSAKLAVILKLIHIYHILRGHLTTQKINNYTKYLDKNRNENAFTSTSDRVVSNY